MGIEFWTKEEKDRFINLTEEKREIVSTRFLYPASLDQLGMLGTVRDLFC